MLAEERYKKIVEIVNDRESIRVSELSQLFKVTEETIRRDLAKLEGEGKLIRSHGGAVSVDNKQPELPYATREVTNMTEKQMIAQLAIDEIHENDRIFLDASTTAWYVAKALPDMPLTVLTNSLKVALQLSEKEKVEVICVGGALSQVTLSFIGPLSESAIEKYYVDKAFISSKGVDLKRGISEANELQARLKEKVIEHSDHVYLMADFSKFGVKALTKVCDLPNINSVIIDDKTDDSIVKALRELDINVRTAKG